MFTPRTLISLILITASSVVEAGPLSRNSNLDVSKSTVHFSRKINTPGTHTFAEMDRARLQALKRTGQLGKHDGSSVSIPNGATLSTISVGVGEPASTFNLVVDIGTSDTWVGARSNNPYKVTSTSKDTGNSVSVGYGVGYFVGEEYLDTVTLSPYLVIKDQSIGVANQSNSIYGDGIFGLGPIDLTEGKVSNTESVPTVTNNLFAQGKILWEAVAIFLAPFAKSGDEGELTFGGVDHSKNTSHFRYAPLTTTSPSSRSWGVDASAFYGETAVMQETSGIIDCGSTLIFFPSDTHILYCRLQMQSTNYQSAIGAVHDSKTGFLRITSSQYSALKTLKFTIGSASLQLTPNAQIWPRSLNSVIGGDPNSIYLNIVNSGNPSGTGLDFILGLVFLERFYTVLDTTHQRIGFADTEGDGWSLATPELVYPGYVTVLQL
ncbi:acid protease [Chiua virens]|nr:acid protease [Chiua virens]